MKPILIALMLLASGVAGAQTKSGDTINPWDAQPSGETRQCALDAWANGRPCMGNGLMASDGRAMAAIVVLPQRGEARPQLLLLEQLGKDIKTTRYLVRQAIDFPDDVGGDWIMAIDQETCNGVDEPTVMLLAPDGKHGYGWTFNPRLAQLIKVPQAELDGLSCDIAPLVKDL